ncbi:MAG: imidazole glycerol-phosphate synthase subunit HisH [Abditibacteriota bacterium]|nr:imidazole glycerol-phosphate synthase subunit HisH [Abditibacteriota bacterium]
MKPIVTVIDYGIGNLFSVSRAIEHCGAEVHLTDSIEEIANAERLVLPGVGAFEDGMQGLAERKLIEPIREYAESGRPFLGICLGMQMMLDVSEEFGVHKGLGLIPGRVQAIPTTGADGQPHKIPHIGWNGLVEAPQAEEWNRTILRDVKVGDAVYFVHSFTPVPEQAEHRLADCVYDGLALAAVIKAGNLYGCQFHPEKSGDVGLSIFQQFVKAS